MNLIIALYMIVLLFFFILIFRNLLSFEKRDKICSICLAVSITWVFLLVMYYLGRFDDIVVISLLMGMTFLGFFYEFEKNFRKEFAFFRLPVLLSLILLGYYLLVFGGFGREFVLVGSVWAVFGLIYTYRKVPLFNKLVNKVVECCKKW